MTKFWKLTGIVTSAVLFCTVVGGWLLPGAVYHAAAQDAVQTHTLYLPLASNGSGVSTATELQNYTIAAAQSGGEVEAAAVDAKGKPVLRPSLSPIYTVSVTKNIVYGAALVTMNGQITPTKLLLDLYEPSNAPAKLRPTILIVHGGAFIRGTRLEANLVRAANEYAARGYVVASMDYRLGAGPNLATTGQFGPFPLVSGRVYAYQQLVNNAKSIHFLDFLNDPVQIAAADPFARLGQAGTMEDTLVALDWLTGQAERRSLDLSRLVMFGGSAGSIDSLYTTYALDDLGIPARRIAAVIDHWGAFNLADANVPTDGTAFMEKGEAPIFIVHGTADVEVPIAFDQAIYDRARQLRIPVKFTPVTGGKHGFNNIDIFTVLANPQETLFQSSVHFLDDVLFANARLVVADQ